MSVPNSCQLRDDRSTAPTELLEARRTPLGTAAAAHHPEEQWTTTSSSMTTKKWTRPTIFRTGRSIPPRSIRSSTLGTGGRRRALGTTRRPPRGDGRAPLSRFGGRPRASGHSDPPDERRVVGDVQSQTPTRTTSAVTRPARTRASRPGYGAPPTSAHERRGTSHQPASGAAAWTVPAEETAHAAHGVANPEADGGSPRRPAVIVAVSATPATARIGRIAADRAEDERRSRAAARRRRTSFRGARRGGAPWPRSRWPPPAAASSGRGRRRRRRGRPGRRTRAGRRAVRSARHRRYGSNASTRT